MISSQKFIGTIVLSLIIGNGTIIAMEEPEKPQGTLSIYSRAMYATAGLHRRKVPANLPSTIEDPFIQCLVTPFDKTKDKFHIFVAAKYLFQPGKTNPLLKIKPDPYHQQNYTTCWKEGYTETFDMTVRCAKDGEDFHAQVKSAMNHLYKSPEFSMFVYDAERMEIGSPHRSWDSKDDFIKAGVVIKKIENGREIWVHGPHGCPNEETLIKSITQ